MRYTLLVLLMVVLYGCQNQPSPTSTPPQQNSDPKTLVPKIKQEPKVKPSVWLPPLEEYEKPQKKEKWFQPKFGNSGGVATKCETCGGFGQMPCPKCVGSGRDGLPLENSTLRDMTLGRRSSNPCIQCDGSGRKSCTTCGGTGYIKESG